MAGGKFLSFLTALEAIFLIVVGLRRSHLSARPTESGRRSFFWPGLPDLPRAPAPPRAPGPAPATPVRGLLAPLLDIKVEPGSSPLLALSVPGSPDEEGAMEGAPVRAAKLDTSRTHSTKLLSLVE